MFLYIFFFFFFFFFGGGRVWMGWTHRRTLWTWGNTHISIPYTSEYVTSPFPRTFRKAIVSHARQTVFEDSIIFIDSHCNNFFIA